MTTEQKKTKMAAKMRETICAYLDRFPTDAKSWRYATDEVRDLAEFAYDCLDDIMGLTDIEFPNFRKFSTPSEWNTKGREFILSAYDRMDYRVKERFYNHFSEWFNPYQK